MLLSPSEAEVQARHGEAKTSILRARLVADLETPVAAYIKLSAVFGQPSFLLESVEGGAQRGRYTMIGLAPDLAWRCTGGKAELNVNFATDKDRFVAEEAPPLESLRELLAANRLSDLPDDLPPMAAGLFGYLGYDMVRQMERLPPPKADPIGVPDAMLIRPTIMVVFDNIKDELSILVPVRPSSHPKAKVAYEQAVERIERVVAALSESVKLDQTDPSVGNPLQAPRSNTDEEDFLAMVARAKEYIRAGDIFQVVLSQRFETPFALPAIQLYRALRRVNPAPFLVYFDFGDFQIVCSSPEILVRVRDGKVTVRPIAGTRPRGQTPAQDRAYAEELLADPKERAEHLMLLDLGRNDVGRVATIGSVNVTDRFFLEYYSQVMHIVSHVEGVLDPRNDTLDALAAGFPAGTVSGAPKIRAMEIIDELERDKRGIYAGCVGYFGANGEMDTCIALRTAVVKDGRMHVQAGAGIVFDSDPKSEHVECINKAKALFRAAEEAIRFAGQISRGQ